MPVVNGGPLKDPAGNALANLPVKIRLIASTTGEGEGYVSGSTVLDTATVFTDSTGVWTATLTANSLITPANTVYELSEPQRGRGLPVVSYITVPNGAGPYNVSAILTTAPTTVTPAGAVASSVDVLIGTANSQGAPSGIVVGTSPGGELGGTWASPTVDASHSGSTHAAVQAAAEATAAADVATHLAADTGAGGKLHFDVTQTPPIVHLNPALTSSVDAANDGRFDRPKGSIAGALAVVPRGGKIQVQPGSLLDLSAGGVNLSTHPEIDIDGGHGYYGATNAAGTRVLLPTAGGPGFDFSNPSGAGSVLAPTIRGLAFDGGTNPGTIGYRIRQMSGGSNSVRGGAMERCFAEHADYLVQIGDEQSQGNQDITGIDLSRLWLAEMLKGGVKIDGSSSFVTVEHIAGPNATGVTPTALIELVRGGQLTVIDGMFLNYHGAAFLRITGSVNGHVNLIGCQAENTGAATSTLQTSLAPGDTTIELNAGAGANWPSNSDFVVKIENEWVIVPAQTNTDDTWTGVLRGQFGTTAAAHTAPKTITAWSLFIDHRAPAGGSTAKILTLVGCEVNLPSRVQGSLVVNQLGGEFTGPVQIEAGAPSVRWGEMNSGSGDASPKFIDNAGTLRRTALNPANETKLYTPASAPTDASLHRRQIAPWFDEVGGRLKFKYKALDDTLSTKTVPDVHADLGSIGTDDHHAKSHGHTGADGSGTVAHSATTGQTVNDHHNQNHTDTQHTDGPNSKNPHSIADHSDRTRQWNWGAINGGGSNGTTATTVGAGTPNATRVLQYPDGSTTDSFWTLGLPDWIVAGSTLSLALLWSPNATDATAHTVRWQVTCEAIRNGVDISSGTTTTTFTGASAARTAHTAVLEAAQQILASVNPNDAIRIAVTRIGADAADTYVGAVNLIELQFSFTGDQ